MARYRLKRKNFGGPGEFLKKTAGSAMQAVGGVADSGAGKLVGIGVGLAKGGIVGGILGGIGASMTGKFLKQSGTDARNL